MVVKRNRPLLVFPAVGGTGGSSPREVGDSVVYICMPLYFFFFCCSLKEFFSTLSNLFQLFFFPN